MEKRTLEIIAVCKGNTRYDSDIGLVDAVKNYMSDTCICDKEYYTDSQMENIMTEALYDFIDVCDKPSYILRKLEEVKWITENLTERICIVFKGVKIRDKNTYVNGFDERYEKIVENLRQ